MKALDFINKEIEGCIKNIDFCKYKGWDAPEYTQRLIDLKEVKKQLEAWEVAKKVINRFDESLIEGLLILLYKSSEIDVNECNNFKEALKVEDE